MKPRLLRLTPRQQWVLDRLAEGWGLWGSPFGPYFEHVYRDESGELHREDRNVHHATFKALISRRLIVDVEGRYPLQKQWVLTRWGECHAAPYAEPK